MDLYDIYKITDELEQIRKTYEFFHEDTRLNRSKAARVEFLTTVRYIERYLTPGASILDVGAGAGEYSLYFARQGYRVSALELAESNLTAFRRKLTPEDEIDLVQGNAVDLSRYEDAIKCGAEMFVFLGDYVSDLSEPQRTMDLVYEIQSKYPTVCLRGNREGYMLDYENGNSRFTRGSKSGSLLFTYEHLRKKDLEFIRGLKIADTIEIEGVRIEIAHAAMDNDRYYFDGNDGHTADIFPQMKCDCLLTGHSHKQYIKQNAEKTIINPGSVGIPQGGTQNPKYALLDIENGSISCQHGEVPYDMTDAIRSQFASGFVDYAKYWAIGILYDIITGEEWVLKLLETVEKTGDFANEETWRSSAIGLGMKLTEQEILEWYQNG